MIVSIFIVFDNVTCCLLEVYVDVKITIKNIVVLLSIVWYLCVY